MHNGRQVTLAHWTGKDASVKHPDVTHEYATYSEGHFEFYRRLFQKARSQINPEAKWIVEPYSVYNDWMRYMDWDFMKAKGDQRREYMPDLVCSEGNGTEFVDNPKNFESGLIDRTRVASTTPNIFDDGTLRKIAGAAASKGAWTGWFGRRAVPATTRATARSATFPRASSSTARLRSGRTSTARRCRSANGTA